MSDEKSAMGGDFVSNLGAAVRSNPLPAALIGMGLVWLFSGGRSSVKAGFGGAVDGLANIGSHASETARTLGQSIGDTVTSASEVLGDSGTAVAQKASDVASSLRQSVSSAAVRFAIDGQFLTTAHANIAHLIQRQPLMLGAIGLAIGAGVAASLRPTAAEVDLVGDASANFQERARDFGIGVTQQAADMADRVTTTIAEEARVQGLTSDGLKQSASEAGRKVKKVIGRSAEHLRSHIN